MLVVVAGILRRAIMVQPAHRHRYRVPTWLVYWVTQLTGWALYIALFQFVNYLDTGRSTPLDVAIQQYFIGVGVSHAMRGIILRNHWLEKGIGFTLPRLILAASLLSVIAFLIENLVHGILTASGPGFRSWTTLEHLGRIINWTLLLSIWSFAYFAYNYFVRHRREEIRNLRLETANRENQLATLRAQLNPHFMFNALNSIRALVDENPEQAKRAITQLSSILRNAMATVKRKTVPLGEEIDIVKAYLALEAIRYEERLRVQFDMEEGLDRELVPPMLMQTLVENAVRHGVAKLPQGGDLLIGVHRGLDTMVLSVQNSGHYEAGKISGTGIGLRNTRKRLEMIYGSGASMNISDRDGMVITEVVIPMRANDIPTEERTSPS